MKLDCTDVLKELHDYAESTNSDKYADTPISNREIVLSESMGMGYNVGSAHKYLSRYVTKGYEKSGNRSDLLKAIHYLMFELIRTSGKVQK